MVPLRLLIIEDSENDASLAVRHLERSGYQVTWRQVEDEAQLAEALSSQEWDIILADYRLPGFDAPHALALLQNTGLDIPFIVVSGAIGEETAVDLMRAGACDYLIKGNLARLGPAVERELAEARSRRERRRADQALRESEANLQRSQQIAHIGHWIYQPQTGEGSWSEELYRIFGMDPAADSGRRNEVWLKRLHPEDAARMAEAQQRLADTGEVEQVEYRIILPDGSLRYVLALTSSPVLDAAGKVVQVSGVVQDITGRKMAELALVEKMEESQKRARELEAVALVSSAMRSAQTREELVAVVLENLMDLLGARFVSLGFLEGGRLIFKKAAGSRGPWVQQEVTARHPAFIEVVREGVLVTVTDPEGDLPNWIVEHLAPGSAVMIYPLVSAQNISGVVLIGIDRLDGLLAEQMNLIAAVASMAGNAVNRMVAAEELERMVARREKELEVIYQVTSAASKTVDHRRALQQALAMALDAVRAKIGAIFLLNESNGSPEWVLAQDVEPGHPDRLEAKFPTQMIQSALTSKQTQLSPEPPNGSGSSLNDGGQVVALPMRSHDRVEGVLVLRMPAGERVMIDELTLLSFIADHLALVVENTRLHLMAERSAVLEERSRLARELHDSVMQLLYSANLYSAGAQRFAQHGQLEKVSDYLGQIGQLTQQALKDMRLMVYQLRTTELALNGLVGALQNRLDAVERRSGVQVVFEDAGLGELPELVEENLYRIALEALNNSLKYAHAKRLWIELKQQDGQALMHIRDDGCGFDPGEASGQGGMGLGTMRERAERLGGRLVIQSAPGLGTEIHVAAPLAGRPTKAQGGIG